MTWWTTQRIALSILISAWVALVSCGMLYLTDYATRRTDGGNVESEWPAGMIPFQDCGPTVLLFLHPRCPCSRASVNQFRQLLADAAKNVHSVAVIRSAPEFQGLRLGNDLSLTVRQIPGISIVPDSTGQIAERFGVATSGHVLLFGADRRLLFSGGITESRGHEGDNWGAARLARALANCSRHQPDSQTAMEAKPALNCVYGCALGAQHELPSRKTTQ